MNLLGYDLGSSSVKASILEVSTGRCLAAASSPSSEMEIQAPKPGWAEQDPAIWWSNLVAATREVMLKSGIPPESIAGIGISYQMHGLVVVDRNCRVLRPAIIWCDSRAVAIGNKAFEDIGGDVCLDRLLNSPGNFTAAKLKWIQDNEPEIYSRVWKAMLPGDYAAMRMTGEVHTTVSGLSEGIFWDFKANRVSETLLDYFGFDRSLIPELVPTFGDQGKLREEAAGELGLKRGIAMRHQEHSLPQPARAVASNLPALPPMSQWVNVRTLDVKGDGKTDDTAALRAAIAKHRALYLPMGVYRVSRSIELRPDTVLIGMNPGNTTISLTNESSGFEGEGDPVAVMVRNSDDIRFENVKVFSQTRLAFDHAVLEEGSGVAVRAQFFTNFVARKGMKAPATAAFPAAFKGAKLEKLASGFSNASGLIVDDAGHLFFTDAAMHNLSLERSRQEGGADRDDPGPAYGNGVCKALDAADRRV